MDVPNVQSVENMNMIYSALRTKLKHVDTEEIMTKIRTRVNSIRNTDILTPKMVIEIDKKIIDMILLDYQQNSATTTQKKHPSYDVPTNQYDYLKSDIHPVKVVPTTTTPYEKKRIKFLEEVDEIVQPDVEIVLSNDVLPDYRDTQNIQTQLNRMEEKLDAIMAHLNITKNREPTVLTATQSGASLAAQSYDPSL